MILHEQSIANQIKNLSLPTPPDTKYVLLFFNVLSINAHESYTQRFQRLYDNDNAVLALFHTSQKGFPNSPHSPLTHKAHRAKIFKGLWC